MGQRLGQWRLLCSMTVEAALFHDSGGCFVP